MVNQSISKRKKRGGGKMFRKTILSVFFSLFLLSLFLLPSYEAFSQPYAYVANPRTFHTGNVIYDITIIDVDTNLPVGYMNIDQTTCPTASRLTIGVPLTSTAGNGIVNSIGDPRGHFLIGLLGEIIVDPSRDRLYLVCQRAAGSYGSYPVILRDLNNIGTSFGFGERELSTILVIDISGIETELSNPDPAMNVIDLAPADVVQIEAGDAPNDIALSPDGRYLYIANGNIPIDYNGVPADDPVLSSLLNVNTLFNGRAIALELFTDSMGNYARDFNCEPGIDMLLDRCDEPDDDGFITRIDLTTVDPTTGEPTYESATFGDAELVNPALLAFTPDGRYLFVADNDYHPLRDHRSPFSDNNPDFSSSGTVATGFEKGNFNSASIAVLDLTGDEPELVDFEPSTSEVADPFPIEERHGISDMMVSPDGTKLYAIYDPVILNFDSSTSTVTPTDDPIIAVFDICSPFSPTPLGFYNVGSNLLSMAFSPDGTELFISRIAADTLQSVTTQVVSFPTAQPVNDGEPDNLQRDINIMQNYNADDQLYHAPGDTTTPFKFPILHQRKLAFSPDGSKLFVTVGETSAFEDFLNNDDPNDPKVFIFNPEDGMQIGMVNINERNDNRALEVSIAIAGQSNSVEGACTEDRQVTCSDGIDNDGDGIIDCADSDCEGQVAGEGMICCSGVAVTAPADGMCPSPIDATEICGDGRDNDLDGRIDCDDADCSTHRRCQPEICDNMRDDDDDGDVDCDDSDCANTPVCRPTPPDNLCADREDGASAGAGMVCCNGMATMGTECPETPPRRTSGSGCTVAGSSTIGTTTANSLLPMLIFGLAFGLRIIRKRK